MARTLRLGRVRGVPIGAHWSLVGVVVLLGYGLAHDRLPTDAPGLGHLTYAVAGLVTAVGLMLGVLVHEAGHAVLARRAGMEVDGITLSWMGGLTQLVGETTSPAWEVAVAGIGPVVSAALGGALVGLHHLLGPAPAGGSASVALASVEWLGVIQLALAAFNLVPASPLDGGRILHGVVWSLCHDRWRASRVASGVGVAFGSVVIGAGLVAFERGHDPLDAAILAFLGWWLIGAARSEAAGAAVARALDGVTVAEVMRPVGAAPGWQPLGAFLADLDAARPGWVWLVESWGGGYSGVLAGDAARAVPGARWSQLRVGEVAVPVTSVAGARPDEGLLACMARTGGRQVVLVVDGGHTVGAVLPADVEALAAARTPLPARPAPHGVG